MTWELLAYIVNGIAVISCFAFIGCCVYVYITNKKTEKHNDELNASDSGWVYANGKLTITGEKNKYEKGTRQGAGLRDPKGGKDETKL